MKKVLGELRRADQDFQMIDSGSHVAVGVSGGKDSLLLLYALALYRRFSPHPFRLTAVTITMGLEPFDLSGVRALCERLEVDYVVRETEIGKIVFEERAEKNPCALCARMRRGALLDLCAEIGADTLALGHHRDDALETLLLSLLYEGRVHTFHPVTRFEDRGLKQIRPLIYLPEGHVVRLAHRLALPVVPSPCPANGNTARAEMKELLDALCRRRPDARDMLLLALKNDAQYSLWEKAGKNPRRNKEER